MIMQTYYKFSFYWFGIIEGILLTSLPSLFFVFFPSQGDIIHLNAPLSDLLIFWIRCGNILSFIGGLVLFSVFAYTRELKAHFFVLLAYLLGDFVYSANLIYANAKLSTQFFNAGFLSVFLVIVVLTLVRACVIAYLYKNMKQA